MKKLFYGALIAIIVVSTAFALVACNGNEDPNSRETPPAEITLTDTMTVDEVMAALDGVENYTIETYESDKLYQVDKFVENGYSRKDVKYEELNVAIWANDVLYNFRQYNGEVKYAIINIKGLDSNFPVSRKEDVKDDLKMIREDMENGGYRIENNALYLDKPYSGLVCAKRVVKDFGSTILDFPEEYMDNYLTLQPTRKALEYEDIDGNTCRLVNVGTSLYTFTIPETYDDKTVVEADVGGHVDILIIPKTIQKIRGLNGIMNITYLGTRDEWYEVNYELNDIGRFPYTVHCTDGDIEEGKRPYEK